MGFAQATHQTFLPLLFGLLLRLLSRCGFVGWLFGGACTGIGGSGSGAQAGGASRTVAPFAGLGRFDGARRRVGSCGVGPIRVD
jgi:hypothetical protein